MREIDTQSSDVLFCLLSASTLFVLGVHVQLDPACDVQCARSGALVLAYRELSIKPPPPLQPSMLSQKAGQGAHLDEHGVEQFVV